MTALRKARLRQWGGNSGRSLIRELSEGSNARTLLLLCAAALCVPLLATPVMPLIDLYNHVARYFVLSHMDEGTALARNYAVNWQLVPNVGLDLIGTALLGFVPAGLAAKLIVFMILMVQFSGVVFVSRALGNRSLVPAALLSTVVLYSFVLNWGFANYLFATGLSLWGVGAWLRLRSNLWLATAVGGVFAVTILLAHAFAFALYGVLIAAIELGRWRGAREPVTELLRGLGGLAATAVLPVILFLMSATAGSSRGALPTDAVLDHVERGSLAPRLIAEGLHRIETIVRVAESPWATLDVVLFFIGAAIVAVGIRSGVLLSQRCVWPALALLAVLAVVTPPAMFGVGFVSDRIPLVFMLVLAASLDIRFERGSLSTVVTAGLIGLAVVRIGAVAVGWSGYARDYADFRRVMRHVPEGALLASVYARATDRRDDGPRRCGMFNTMAVPLDGAITPLFADPRMQPISQQGPLLAAIKSLPPRPRSAWVPSPPHYSDLLLSDIVGQARFDYVLVCGRSSLTRPLPEVRETHLSGDFALLQLR